MTLESELCNHIVRVQYRLPDVRDTMVEALFVLRRQRWVEPLGKVKRHG